MAILSETTQVFEDQKLYHAVQLNLEIPSKITGTGPFLDTVPAIGDKRIYIAVETAHIATMWAECLVANAKLSAELTCSVCDTEFTTFNRLNRCLECERVACQVLHTTPTCRGCALLWVLPCLF